MKRITVLFILILMVGITHAGKPAAETLQNLIKTTIQYPDEAIRSGIQGDISVVFKLNDEGAINIVKMISTNQELEKYVKECLEKISVIDIDGPYNQHFQINLRFELEL